MALYFNDQGLQDEDGVFYPVSWQKVLEECLKHPFNTISVSIIIFESIEKVVREKVVRNNYNQSMFYCWLERNVQADVRYNIIKQEKIAKDNELRKARKKNSLIIRNRKGTNIELDKRDKESMRRYYKTKSSLMIK